MTDENRTTDNKEIRVGQTVFLRNADTHRVEGSVMRQSENAWIMRLLSGRFSEQNVGPFNTLKEAVATAVFEQGTPYTTDLAPFGEE